MIVERPKCGACGALFDPSFGGCPMCAVRLDSRRAEIASRVLPVLLADSLAKGLCTGTAFTNDVKVAVRVADELVAELARPS